MRRISVVILSLLMIASMLLSACQPAPTPVAEQPKEEKPAEQPAQAEQPKEEQPAAAKPGIEDGVLTIAWIPKALNNPVFETGRVGAELKAKELSEQGKIKVEILYTAPTKSDIAEQAAVMEGVIAKGVDAIGVSCNEPEGCVDPINKAVEAGIPVMTWDSDSPNSKRFTYLGVDNKEGGKAAAELLKMALPNGGKVALLTGVPGAANLEARIAGFKEGVEGSNIEIVDTVACNDDIQKGVQVVEETMTKYPDLNGWFFVGLWPIFAGEGAMPKWEEATKKGMKSVAFDTLPVELDWVKKGMLYGLVGQKYFGWGYDTVQMIYDKIVNGKEFEPFTNSGMDIVTICNVDEMAKAWESNDFTKPLSDWKCDKLTGAAPAAEAPAAAAAGLTANPDLKGKLEIFSWWTAGGEAEGLNAMFEVYKKYFPNVEIVNATVAGGAGTNAKAVLATRLQGGNPPDSFQVHAGLEVEKYSPMEYLQPVDEILDPAVYPKDLLSMLKYEDHYWGVPVNIHRSNVLWYNKKIFQEVGIEVPKTMDEFFAACEKIKAKGYIPVTMGTKEGWEAAHVFEGFLAAELGADDYIGLWNGKTAWSDPRVTKALENFKKMFDYVNTDHAAMTWDGAGEYLIADKAAMMIMGDWTAGWFASKKYADYGWSATPGTIGIFVGLSDSFSLPKGAPNEAAAKAWLAVCGSKEGQEAFNPKKGSICARTDCDNAAFKAVPETYEYLTSAAQDWQKDRIVPSIVHGAATYESWATAFKDTVALFVSSGDVAAAQTSLGQLCVDAGICK